MLKQNYSRSVVTFISLLIFLCLEGFGKPKSLSIKSSIQSVTVFSNRSMITRFSQLELKPGRYQLKFSPLPIGLINDSIRVSGKGTARAKILNVKVKKDFLEESFILDVQKLAKKNQQVDIDLLKIQDRIKTLEKKEELLNNLTHQLTKSITKRKTSKISSLEEWQKSLDFYEKKLLEIISRKRTMLLKKAELDKLKSLLTAKLQQRNKRPEKEVKNALVDIVVNQAGNINVLISYLVPGGSWQPVYDLRLSTTAKKALLNYSAMVQQDTGEDWENVKLSLSTAKPLQLKRIPGVTPIFLDLQKIEYGMVMGNVYLADHSALPGALLTLYNDQYNKTAVSNENGKYSFSFVPTGTYDFKADLEGFKSIMRKGIRVYNEKISKINAQLETSTIMQETVMVTGEDAIVDLRRSNWGVDGANTQYAIKGLQNINEMELQRPNMSNHGISASFELKYKDSISSDAGLQKVTIAEELVSSEIEIIAVPRYSEYCFVKAKLINSSSSPLLPGRINIFYNGMFVNTSTVKFINPGQTFDLTVGVEEAVKVKRIPLSEEKASTGLLKSKKTRTFGYKIVVHNQKKENISITVLDQIPVSKSKKIKVTAKEMNPEPTKENKKTKDGILKWNLHLKGGAKRDILVEYKIKHPKGIDLEEYN